MSENRFQSSVSKCLNPLFRKMADATCASVLTDRPEWAAVAQKYEGATLVEIDSALISYDIDANGAYQGRAGILIETPATADAPATRAVLAAKVFGRITEQDEPQIEKIVIDVNTRDTNRAAFYRLNAVPA